MKTFKCEMSINQGREGWRESVFVAAPHATGALDALYQLATVRGQLLGEGARLVHLLVSDVTGRGNSLSGCCPTLNAPGPAAPPWTALLLRLEGGAQLGYHRSYYLRGLPADWVSDSSGRFIYQMSLAAVQKYVAVLVEGRFLLRVSDREAPSLAITDIGPVAPPDLAFAETGYIILTTDRPHDLQVVDGAGRQTIVGVSGVSWFPSLPPGRRVAGNYPLLIVNENQLLLGGGSVPSSGIYTGGGVVQPLEPIYVPIRQGVPLRTVKKSTGRARPFDGLAVVPPPPPPEVIGLPAVVPPPPIPVPIPAPLVPTSPPDQINNAHDLAALVWAGYPSDVLSIAVAQVLNRPQTWLVAIPGTNADTNANWPNAILAGFGINTSYSLDVATAVLKGAPPGSTLILAGHSQGGMVAQNLVGTVKSLGYNVSDVVCFGSPPTVFADPGVRYTFFSTPADPVPHLSPLSLAQTLDVFLLRGYPSAQRISSPVPPWQPVGQHNSYPDSPDLLNYDAAGLQVLPGLDALRLQLGPITRYGVKAP